MVPEMLRRLLPVVWAHRAFASLSRLTFGSTGAILMFHEVQEDPDGELRTGCSPGFLDALVRGLIAAGWDIVALDEALRRVRCRTGNRFVVITFDYGYRDTFTAPALFWSDIRRRSRCMFRPRRSRESSMRGGWGCARSSGTTTSCASMRWSASLSVRAFRRR